jgi:branched-chain amino acid transport system permease protein
VICLLPFWTGPYYLQVFTIAFYYVVLASSWNLIAVIQDSSRWLTMLSQRSEVMLCSVGHPFGLPIWMGILAALLSSTSWLHLRRFCLRMRAIYLAIATWAFAESVRIFLHDIQNNARRFRLAVPKIFLGTGRAVACYYLFLGLRVTVVVIFSLIVQNGLLYSCHPQ